MNDKKNIEELLKMATEDVEGLEKYIKEFSAFLPLAVCTVNPLAVILFVNSAFQKLTGYKEIEIIGGKLEDLFFNKKDFNNLITSKILEKETSIVRRMTLLTKDKKKIAISMAISARRDEMNNFSGYFIALSDITEFDNLKQELEKKVKKRTKDLEERTQEIAESRVALMNILEDAEEAKLNAENERDKTLAIFENFPEGILFFDEDNNLSSVNPRARDFLHLDTKKIIGRSAQDLKEKSALSPIVEILGTEIKETYNKELELKNDLILEISAIPVIRDNKKIGILVILRDVTREKTVERLKTEFVSISAHQLRTPLSGVKWTLKMLLEGDLGEISNEQKKFLEKTYKSNERMIRLINDLLNVTRIEEGRFLYNIKNHDIVKIAQGIVASSSAMAERKKIDLKFQKPKDKIPEARVDIEKISIVFQNLVDNAIHYTKNGGKVNVSIKYLKDEKNILISVEDTGIGIPKNQKKRIFKRFYRGVDAVKMETVGTGLGLFIAKNIVEAHGGKIWFESVENKGTTFYFIIPATIATILK